LPEEKRARVEPKINVFLPGVPLLGRAKKEKEKEKEKKERKEEKLRKVLFHARIALLEGRKVLAAFKVEIEPIAQAREAHFRPATKPPMQRNKDKREREWEKKRISPHVEE
jgi:hypothetical protein